MMFSLSSCGSCVSITRCSSLWLAKAMERQVLWPGVQLTNKLWLTRRRPTRNASSIYLLHKHQSNFLVKEFLERTACDNRFFSLLYLCYRAQFLANKISTGRTSDGLLRPVSIISKFNRIDCEWAEPERLGFAKKCFLPAGS